MSSEPVSDERLRKIVRDVLAEEVDRGNGHTRRQFLGALGAGGTAGLLAGAGSAAAASNDVETTASVGQVAPNVYEYSSGADGSGYTGPNSARNNISADVGDLFFGWDANDQRIWRGDGSNWDQMANLGAIQNKGNYTEIEATGSSDHVTINDAITSIAGNGSGLVDLAAGNEFTLSGTIQMQAGVTLRVNRNTFTCTTDDVVIEAMPDSEVVGDFVVIDKSSLGTPTASNIRLDGPTNGPFRTFGTDDHFQMNCMVLHFGPGNYPANNYQQACVQLIGGDTSGTQVTNQHLGYHFVDNMSVIIRGDANIGGSGTTGFLNNNQIYVNANRHKVGGIHRGVGEGKIQVRGHLQASDVSYFINEASQTKSFRFHGHLEDQQRVGTAVFQGDAIKAWGNSRFNVSGNAPQPKSDWGSGTTFNGFGYESGTANDPNNITTNWATGVGAGLYFPGEMIIYEDTDDGTGSGLYVKGPYEQAESWIQVASGSSFIGTD